MPISIANDALLYSLLASINELKRQLTTAEAILSELRGRQARETGDALRPLPYLIPAKDKPVRNDPQQLVYTPKQAAQALGISTVSLWRLEKRGLIKPSRALRTPRFTRAEIDRFLKDTTV